LFQCRHRRVAPVPPQLLKNLESMPVSQLEIEDDSVVVVYQCEGSRFLSGRGSVYGVGFVAEHTGHQLQYALIVIDYENAHPALGSIWDTSDWESPSIEYR